MQRPIPCPNQVVRERKTIKIRLFPLDIIVRVLDGDALSGIVYTGMA